MRDALRQSGQGESGLRLHELKLADGQYDCTVRIDDQGLSLLEFHNLNWEHKRLRLQQRELQTGLLGLFPTDLIKPFNHIQR